MTPAGDKIEQRPAVDVGSTDLVCAIDRAYQMAKEYAGDHPSEYQQGVMDGLDTAQQITLELIHNMNDWCNQRRDAPDATTLGDVQRYLANLVAHTRRK